MDVEYPSENAADAVPTAAKVCAPHLSLHF